MRLRNIPGSKEAIAESAYVIQNPEKRRGCWQEVFGNQNPVQIEVGMGKGRFIMDMARLHPEVNYICGRFRRSNSWRKNFLIYILSVQMQEISRKFLGKKK